jgi:ferredoxin
VLELNRVVERASVKVKQVADEKGKLVGKIDALAGDDLRRMLLRRDIRLGQCGGEGQCGTCHVYYVLEGMDLLGP